MVKGSGTPAHSYCAKCEFSKRGALKSTLPYLGCLIFYTFLCDFVNVPKCDLKFVFEVTLFMLALSSQVLKTLHKLKDMDITVDILSVSHLQIL